MAQTKLPDELVEAEIARLNKLPTVKLAQKERRIIAGRRKYLSDLRWLEKRGKALMADGWTMDTIELLYRNGSDDM